MNSKPTLGYWNIRGLAQPIRYLLVISGVDFNDKRYQFGEGNTFEELESLQKYWKPDKESLGLDFPNLPYYIDGNIKITQSIAILRFLARKYKLYGEDDESLIRQDVVEQQLNDFRMHLFLKLLMTNTKGKPGFEEAKIEFVKSLPDHLKLFSKFLGENKWFTSEKLNYVDLLAYETFDWIRLLSPGTIEQFDNLSHFMNRFENLPAIKEYRNSKDYVSWPLFGPFFQFGSD